jgi:hypothetical protein
MYNLPKFFELEVADVETWGQSASGRIESKGQAENIGRDESW